MGRYIRPYGRRYLGWEFVGEPRHPRIVARGPNNGYIFHHTVTIPQAFKILTGKMLWREHEDVIFAL